MSVLRVTSGSGGGPLEGQPETRELPIPLLLPHVVTFVSSFLLLFPSLTHYFLLLSVWKAASKPAWLQVK